MYRVRVRELKDNWNNENNFTIIEITNKRLLYNRLCSVKNYGVLRSILYCGIKYFVL